MTEDSKFLSRKFMLAAFVVLMAVPLLMLKFIDPTTYVTITGSTLALYFTGNVVQKFTLTKE